MLRARSPVFLELLLLLLTPPNAAALFYGETFGWIPIWFEKRGHEKSKLKNLNKKIGSLERKISALLRNGLFVFCPIRGQGGVP